MGHPVLRTLADRVKGSLMAPTPFPAASTSTVPRIHRDAAAPGPRHKMGAQDSSMQPSQQLSLVEMLHVHG